MIDHEQIARYVGCQRLMKKTEDRVWQWPSQWNTVRADGHGIVGEPMSAAGPGDCRVGLMLGEPPDLGGLCNVCNKVARFTTEMCCHMWGLLMLAVYGHPMNEGLRRDDAPLLNTPPNRDECTYRYARTPVVMGLVMAPLFAITSFGPGEAVWLGVEAQRDYQFDPLQLMFELRGMRYGSSGHTNLGDRFFLQDKDWPGAVGQYFSRVDVFDRLEVWGNCFYPWATHDKTPSARIDLCVRLVKLPPAAGFYDRPPGLNR